MLPRFTDTPACEGMDTELWFTESKEYDNEEMLRKICNNCSVKQECLDYALEYKVLGWWAGTTAKGREKLRIKRGIKGKPIVPAWETYGA